MDNYLLNLKLWYLGFKRFGELRFKPGWSADGWGWRILYGLDYLATPLFLAGPVVSLSWYFHNRWFSLGYHGANAGNPLWGSVRCEPWVRLAVPLFWVWMAWLIT